MYRLYHDTVPVLYHDIEYMYHDTVQYFNFSVLLLFLWFLYYQVID